MVDGGPASGVLGNDLIDLLGDFTGDGAVARFSASLDFDGIFFDGDTDTPFVVCKAQLFNAAVN